MALVDEGSMHFVTDAEIDADRFLDLVAAHDIGDGELEAIAVCENSGEALCSDDGSARNLAAELLGQDRVCGSLRLLRRAVELEGLPCDLAFEGYQGMLAHGAWLPALQQTYFCQEPGC